MFYLKKKKEYFKPFTHIVFSDLKFKPLYNRQIANFENDKGTIVTKKNIN